MPNEGEGNDPSLHDHGTRGWQNQGRHGVDKETGELTCNTGSSPGSRDASHNSRAISTIGRGNEHQSNTSEQHEKSVPTSVSCTQSTQWTSQQPWIPWTLPTWRSHQPLTQEIKWHLSDGSMYTRST